MEKNAQPQGRVLRRAAEHPSSMRTVAGTLTHVDATNKMTTGPSFDMAFLDNYLSSQSSDLNTPEIDLKAFNFGKDNVKSKLTVTRMEASKMVASPQPTPENTAFFDMSISSPPAFGDEEQTSSSNKFAELCNSEDLDNSLMAIDTVEERIPKAPLLANSIPIDFMSFGNNTNPVTQPSEMPFDIPKEFFNDDYLFPDAELELEDDQLISSLKLDLGMYLQNQENKDDILSQAVAELPSPEQLNNLLETPGMMPPTFIQQQPPHLAPVELFPDLLASSLPVHDTMQSNSATQELIIPVQSNSAQQEIVIPNFFHNNTEYQTVTYQVQDFTSNTFQQVQNNERDSIQLMDVDNTLSKFIDSNSSDSTMYNFLPSPFTYSAPTIELPEESDIKPIVDMCVEAVPSTSSGKRRRTTQKPARYRDSLEHPCDESQPPSTSFIGGKKLKLTDEEKYHRIRIMNNEASRKCRQKRKQKNINVEQEIVELENKQISLKAKEAELIKMRDKMKALYYEFMKRKVTPR